MMLQIVDQIILTTSPQQAMHQSKLQIFFCEEYACNEAEREKEREEKIVSFIMVITAILTSQIQHKILK